MGLTCWLKTSVRNCPYLLRNDREERTYHVYVYLIHVCCTKISILWVKVLRKTNTPPHTYIDKHEVLICAYNANVFVGFNVGVYIIGCVSIVCGFIVIWHSRQVILYTLHKTWFIYLLISVLGAFLKLHTGHMSVCPSTSAPKLRCSPAFYRIILIIF